MAGAECSGGLTSSAAGRPAPAHLVCNLPILVREGGGDYQKLSSTASLQSSNLNFRLAAASLCLEAGRVHLRNIDNNTRLVRGGECFLCNKDWVKWSTSRGTGEREGLQLSLFVLVFRRGWHSSSSSSRRILVTREPPPAVQCPDVSVQFFYFSVIETARSEAAVGGRSIPSGSSLQHFSYFQWRR